MPGLGDQQITHEIRHYERVVLPEDEDLASIKQWFAEKGFDLRVHSEPPPRRDPRTVSRKLRKIPAFACYCDLVSHSNGQVVLPWYGGGDDAADAIRRARQRWRQEQEASPSQPPEGQRPPLP